MGINRYFLDTVNSLYRPYIIKEFTENKVTFDKTIKVVHEDGSIISFNNAYSFVFGKDYIVLSEHLGYFIFDDTDLGLKHYENFE